MKGSSFTPFSFHTFSYRLSCLSKTLMSFQNIFHKRKKILQGQNDMNTKKWWAVFNRKNIAEIHVYLETDSYISNLPSLNRIQLCYFQYNPICYCAERYNTFKSEADCLWMSRMAGSSCLHSLPQTKTQICSLSVFHSISGFYVTHYCVSWELRQNLTCNFIHSQIRYSMAALSNVWPCVCAAGMIYSFRLCLFQRRDHGMIEINIPASLISVFLVDIKSLTISLDWFQT